MPDLPDFFVIGAMKGATTSLFRYVVQHPDVFEQTVKEPQFFNADGAPPPYAGPGDDRHIVDRHPWDEAWYRDLYRRPEGQLAGDYSVAYLPDPDAIDRIARLVPEPRIVAVLRDPVTRAHSAWRMWRALGPETLSFPDALAAEADRTAAGYAPVWRYRGLGYYGEQVSRWIDRFGDDAVLVLRTEDLATDPVPTVQRVYAHIGADPTFTPDTTRRANVGEAVPRSAAVQGWMRDSRSRSKRLAMRVPQPLRQAAGKALRRSNAEFAELDPAVGAELRRGYAADVELLMRRTGLDVAHWLPAADLPHT